MEKTVPLIRFEHFSFRYRAQKMPTLVDINLSIYPGEKVLVVGPSGSGKSTLAYCINGLIPFSYRGESTGCLWVAGVETKLNSLFNLSKIVGTVLQDSDGQFVGLTAAEDIAFSLENDCVPQPEMIDRVQRTAFDVGVRDQLGQSPYTLSGGQKQRVSMAGVLIDRVQILLFDEPLANLDPATGKQAMELIDRIIDAEHTTAIVIEHRLEDVLHRKVDRIVLIDEGRIVADMPPAQFLCGNLLKRSGIREPLYLEALRYAGVRVTPRMRPTGVDTLTLSDEDGARVRKWIASTTPVSKPSASKALLTADNIHFSYEAGKPVLHNIRFSIRQGEMVAIVGANGAGKSTLAKLICGFEKPSTGRILFNDMDLATQSIAERAAHIGFVMQNPNQMISKPMVFDEVALGLACRSVNPDIIRRRVEEALHTCGLYPFRNWPISALSFGQKKRVTIASVLVMQPEIIILDEPTAGQDYRHYTEIMRFITSLNRLGVTVLMITHDMHLMLEYATRALVFADGKLIADQDTAKVLTNPKLAEEASLKATSLFSLAQIVGIEDATALVQRFIEREQRDKANEQEHIAE